MTIEPYEVRVVLVRRVQAKNAFEAIEQITAPLRATFNEDEIGIVEAGAEKVDAERERQRLEYEHRVELRRQMERSQHQEMRERDFLADYERDCAEGVEEHVKRKRGIMLIHDLEQLTRWHDTGTLEGGPLADEHLAALHDLKWRIGREVFGLSDEEVGK